MAKKVMAKIKLHNVALKNKEFQTDIEHKTKQLTTHALNMLQKNKLLFEVKEKVVISKYATVGIYLYTKGKHFVNAAIDMIINNDRVNNEFYTCPTYNYAIKNGMNIGIYNIDYKQMHGLGTPDDLKKYLKLLKSRNSLGS